MTLGQSIESLSFNFRISRNAPLVDGTPSISWPQQLDSWQAVLTVENSTNFPLATNVLFNGPEGSGFTNLMTTCFWQEEEYYYAAYEADILELPPTPPEGIWTVAYDSTNLTFTKPSPQTENNFFMVVPHFEITNGYLVSMSWTYHEPSTGAILSSMPDGVNFVDVSLYGPDYDRCGSDDYKIYDFSIARSDTYHVFNPPIVWSNAMFQFECKDSIGNEYLINYSFGNLYQVWGADTFLVASYCDPETNGYTLLGSATNTATFTGSYNWYMIRVHKHNIAMVDTVEGSDCVYYNTDSTGNTSDHGNIGGVPDGQYSTVGISPRGFYTGGYFFIDATGRGLSSITVYTLP